MNKEVEKISILKAIGGYRINVTSNILTKEGEVYKNTHKDNFFVLEENEISKIKKLEKLILNKIDNLFKDENYIRNITNLDIIKIGEQERVNISVDTIDLDGLLIETNHRYSLPLTAERLIKESEEEGLVDTINSIEKYITKKIEKINSL